jgi:hypothetical protein
MNRFLNPDTVRTLGDPGPGAPLTPGELGEHAAHLVWESYSDFMISDELSLLMDALGLPTVEGIPDEYPAKELLIFHLWAHTRAIQLGLGGRGEPQETVRAVLDALHRAVFEDLEGTGYPASFLPVFEQRVSARYAEYYQAAEVGDDRVGEVAAHHLVSGEPTSGVPEANRVLTTRAVEVARPFRDFVEDVVLREA